MTILVLVAAFLIYKIVSSAVLAKKEREQKRQIEAIKREQEQRRAEDARMKAEYQRQQAATKEWQRRQIALEKEQIRQAKEQERQAREQERLAKEQEKQAEVLRKHEEEIRNLKCKVKVAEERYYAQKAKIENLEEIYEIVSKELEEASRAGDDKRKEKALRKIVSLDNQLSSARVQMEKATLNWYNAKQRMSA